MFQGFMSLGGTSTISPMSRSKNTTLCIGPACDRVARAKIDPPLCAAHYYQWRKDPAGLRPIKPAAAAAAVCTEPGCTTTKLALRSPARCHAHYFQEKVCLAAGCELRVHARDYCATHYAQFNKHGRTWTPAPGKRSPFCHEPGCGAETPAIYCEAHKATRYGVCESIECDTPLASSRAIYCRNHARRDRWFRHSYNLSLRQVESMRAQQDGRCAICRTAGPLHVDHCHDTGEVRGLLCGPCNRAIGLLAHDQERLARAADYLSVRR